MMCELLRADLSNPKHADAVLSLLNEYAVDIMGGGEELGTYTQKNLIDELRKRPTCHVILAYVGEKPAGIAINFEGFSTFACRPILNIHDFAVAPEFRGQGVARAMLGKVEEVAREIGCNKLTLEVLEGNHRAQAVYQKFGFAGYELDPAMGRALFYEKKLDVA